MDYIFVNIYSCHWVFRFILFHLKKYKIRVCRIPQLRHNHQLKPTLSQVTWKVNTWIIINCAFKWCLQCKIIYSNKANNLTFFYQRTMRKLIQTNSKPIQPNSNRFKQFKQLNHSMELFPTNPKFFTRACPRTCDKQ